MDVEGQNAPNETNAGTNDSTNSDNNGQNNPQFTDLWDNGTSEGDSEGSNNNSAATTDSGNPNELFNNYVNSLNFTDGIDVQKVIADLNEGNLESFQQALKTAAANAYKTSMTDMQKVLDAKIAKAIDEAANRSVSMQDSKMLLKDLNAKYPFTASPEIAPIAKTVMQQLIQNKKVSPSEAIEQTAKFFEHITNKIKPDSGGKGNQNRSSKSDVDWTSVFNALDGSN